MTSYHNTNSESGETLKSSEHKAIKQEDAVLAYFKRFKDHSCTPDAVYIYMVKKGHNWPITSIRRAITNLTDKGMLIKTRIQQLGSYGKKCFTWRYREPQGAQLSVFDRDMNKYLLNDEQL